MCDLGLKTKIVSPIDVLGAYSDIRRNNGRILKVTEVVSVTGNRKIIIKHT